MLEILLGRLSKSLYDQVLVVDFIIYTLRSDGFIFLSGWSKILVHTFPKKKKKQALRKISKFVKTNTLPGAVEEVGLLCCACIHSNREEAVNHLIEPLLLSVISSLEDTLLMGFSEGEISNALISIKVFMLWFFIRCFFVATRFFL